MSENPRIYPFRRAGIDAKLTAKKSLKLSMVAQIGGLALAAFFLARAQILGDLYPFAPAFLVAVAAVYPRKGSAFIIPVLLGLISAMPLNQTFAYGAICLLLTAIFIFYRVDSKKQWFIIPGMVLTTVLVCKGLHIAIIGFNNYRILISVFEAILSAGLALVFLVVFNALRRFDISRRFSTDETVCVFVALMGVVCGFSGLSIYNMDIQSIFSRFLIMGVAFLGGPGAGTAMGALIGIVPSLSNIVSPVTVATFSFAGLLGGVFGGFGRLGTGLGFILGNLILALYMLTGEQISQSLIASLVAALFFFLIPTKLFNNLHRAFSVTGLRSTKEEKNERLLRLAVRRMRNCGWMFRDLSHSLSELSVEETPDEEDNLHIPLEQLSYQLCSQCSLQDICWQLDRDETYRGVIQLFESVRINGLASVKDAPDNFSRRCPHIKELVAIANCLYGLYLRSNYWNNQKEQSRRLLSRQLNGVADVMEKISKEISDYGEEREVLERELQKAIAKRGLPIDNAGIVNIGEKSIDIWAQYLECPGELFCQRAIEEEVSRLLGYEFSVHNNSCGGRNCVERCEYRLLAKGAYNLLIGQAQLAKDKGGICGDSGGSMLLEEGKQLLMISDGMGSGAKAAAESTAALTIVSRLLETGFSEDTAIDTINAALSLRGNEESFVTLDLCIVDLYTGAADFVKTGGAASFIKRGGNVRMIKGGSLPVGMIYAIDKEVIGEKLLPGDMIIMGTDGLLDMDTMDDHQWLMRILEQATAPTAQTMAEYLLDKVVSVSNGRVNDDITVLVAQLGEIA